MFCGSSYTLLHVNLLIIVISYAEKDMLKLLHGIYHPIKLYFTWYCTLCYTTMYQCIMYATMFIH